MGFEAQWDKANLNARFRHGRKKNKNWRQR